MQIVDGDDPDVSFQNFALRHKAEIRGEMLITDIVSNGTLAPEPLTEKKQFRTRIGLESDAELLKKLEERVGQSVVADAEESVLRLLQTVIMTAALFGLLALTVFFVLRWVSGGGSPLTFGRSK